MKHLLAVVAFLVTLSFSICSQELPVPIAPIDMVVDTYHGVQVQDPYQWMENLEDSRLEEWLAEQEAFAQDEMKKSKKEVSTLLNSVRHGFSYRAPFKRGPYYFSMTYENAYSPAVLYARRSVDGGRFRVLDPAKIDREKNVDLKQISVSGDAQYIAFTYTEDGSDRHTIGVATMKGKVLSDRIKNIKFSTIEWRGNGFYYLSSGEQAFADAAKTPTLYYHKLGTDASEDEIIFERKVEDFAEIDIQTTSDERYLIIQEKYESRGYANYFYMDFNAEDPRLRPLVYKSKYEIRFLDNYDDRFLCLANHKGNNGFIFFLDVKDPKNWVQLIPEGEDVLILNALPLKDQVLVNYYGDGRQYLVFVDLNGQLLHTITMPWGMRIGSLTGDKTTDEISYTKQSYVIPPILYKIRLKDYKEFLVQAAEVDFNFGKYMLSPIHYVTSDSVEVTLLVLHNEKIKMDGSNMCLLEAYGGFGAIDLPSLRSDIVTFLEKGGMYARALIRGGGDKGKQWHRAGKRLNRQRSLDDFIEAAETLINKGYTSPDKLAISGASHGGMLVAAVAMQRPDLFKTVVARVGDFDVVRAEKFTVGSFHKDEFGTVENEVDFKNLYSYSPYHNIDTTVNYPTMLIMTSEFDDRVPPFHSYKYVASLQANPSQKNPIYLYVEKDAGHSGARTFRSNVAEDARRIGFILRQLEDDKR